MNKEFVPYVEALELKQLGFDELCYGWYDGEYKDIINYDHTRNSCGWLNDSSCSSPTFSQAFRFFREKFKLHSYIEGAYPWFRYYINSHDNIWEGHKHLIHEEAELYCLRKLIEIVKTKQ